MRITATLQGAAQTQALLRGAAVTMAAREVPYFVGTAVVYARYLEFGTSRMTARPFMRPAAMELRARGLRSRVGFARGAGGRFTFSNTPTELYIRTVPPGGITANLASQHVRTVRKIIDRKGLVRTTNLRRSIASGRTVAVMLERSRSRAILPGTTVGE